MFVLDAEEFVKLYLSKDNNLSRETLIEAVCGNSMVLNDKYIAKWEKHYTTDCEGSGAPFEYSCSNCGYTDKVLKPKCPKCGKILLY